MDFETFGKWFSYSLNESSDIIDKVLVFSLLILCFLLLIVFIGIYISMLISSPFITIGLSALIICVLVVKRLEQFKKNEEETNGR